VLDHQATSQCVAIERAVLAALGGDCTLPIGVHASLLAQRPPMVQVRAVMANLKGQEVRQELTAPLLSPEAGNELAKTLATQLLAAGGREILASLAAGWKAP
jgi:hydroxymethylbilane synthase